MVLETSIAVDTIKGEDMALLDPAAVNKVLEEYFYHDEGKTFQDKIEELYVEIVKNGELPIPVHHVITEGLYSRYSWAPAGSVVISNIHKQQHQFMMVSGCCTVLSEKGLTCMVGPIHGVTEPGTQRVVYIHEDTAWITFHPTQFKEIADIEQQCFETYRSTLVDRLDFEMAARDVGLSPEEISRQSFRPENMCDMPEDHRNRVYKAMSRVHGDGMFAAIAFRKGDVIAPASQGPDRTPIGRFTNHAKTPNAEFFIGKDKNIWARAISNIKAGEEILIDYRASRRVALLANHVSLTS